MRWLLALVLLAAAAAPARAEDPAAPTKDVPAPVEPAPVEEPPPGESVPAEPGSDFGPLLLIERIDVIGNTATQDDVIRRALPFRPGDVLRASDARLREARFKVLALGFFRDVKLALTKGSERGQVLIEVRVVERGTIALNRLWFGTTALSPYWAGADLGDRNLFGTGIGIGAGFVYAADGEIEGARPQWAVEVRGADPSLLGTRWGVNGAFSIVHGSEPYRIGSSAGDPEDSELRAFPYRRVGLRLGTTYNASALTRLSAGLRVEQVRTTLPVAPTRELPDGRLVPVDLHLAPGTSHIVGGGVGYDRDTRPNPILPHSGDHLALGAELGARAFGGDYQFASLFGRYERYWPLRGDQHAIAVKLAGGVVIGNPPRFDRIHIGDVDRMLTPRALGLVLSAVAPLDLLGTRPDKPQYGDLGGIVHIEYAWTLFRGTRHRRLYGGDLFFGVGVWGLAETTDLRARDASAWNSLPIDVYVDAGIRLDTDIGIFEITLANALGRFR